MHYKCVFLSPFLYRSPRNPKWFPSLEHLFSGYGGYHYCKKKEPEVLEHWERINVRPPVLSSSDFFCITILHMFFNKSGAHLTTLCLLNQFTKLTSALQGPCKASELMSRAYSRLRVHRLLYCRPTPRRDDCLPRMICVCYDTCL